MLLEILITKHERSYHVIFPYKHQIGWRRFKAIGMVFKEPDNVGGVMGKVYWTIPLSKLDEAIDSITYWYTEHPQIGEPPYGVRVEQPEATEAETLLTDFAAQYQETLEDTDYDDPEIMEGDPEVRCVDYEWEGYTDALVCK